MPNPFRRKKSWHDHFQEGIKRGSTSDFAGAEASFREAVRLAPDEPYPHYELGYTLALVGRHEEALEEFNRTQHLSRAFFAVETEIWMCEQILSGSIDASVLDNLRSLQALADEGQAQSDDAAALSRKVIERAPDCALGHFHLGKAVFEDDPPLAMEELRRCIELSPDDTTAINAKWHLGALLEEDGRQEDARALWDEIVSDYTGHPAAEFARSLRP